MTKDEVKTLCEADPKLQWWAMVLFAELLEFHEMLRLNPRTKDNERFWVLASDKVAEFPRLVIQRQLEKAAEERNLLVDLEVRVAKLESLVGDLVGDLDDNN